MKTEVTEGIAGKVRETSSLLPEPLRHLDPVAIYRILLHDARGEVMPAELMESPEMAALEGAGLMHEEVVESTHLGVTVEHFQGYRGDDASTALLNRIRSEIGEPPVERTR